MTAPRERTVRGGPWPVVTDDDVAACLLRQRRWLPAIVGPAAVVLTGYVVVAGGLYPTLALAVIFALGVGAWLLFRRTVAHRDGPARRRAGVRAHLALRRYADPGEPYRSEVADAAPGMLVTSPLQVVVLVVLLLASGVGLATADGSAVVDAGPLTAAALLLAVQVRVKRDARRWIADPPYDAADSTT